jgi:hypothetical protein
MQGTTQFTVQGIKNYSTTKETPNGWKPARPIGLVGFCGLRNNIKNAWKVLFAKADIVVWD